MIDSLFKQLIKYHIENKIPFHIVLETKNNWTPKLSEKIREMEVTLMTISDETLEQCYIDSDGNPKIFVNMYDTGNHYYTVNDKNSVLAVYEYIINQDNMSEPIMRRPFYALKYLLDDTIDQIQKNEEEELMAHSMSVFNNEKNKKFFE